MRPGPVPGRFGLWIIVFPCADSALSLGNMIAARIPSVFFALVFVAVGLSGFASHAHAASLSASSILYQDLNTDGRVDNIKISFADVTLCTFESADWSVGVAGSVGITAVTGISNSGTCAEDNYLNLTVTGTSNITGGDTDPRIDYANAETAGSLIADGNEDAASFVATDGASPVVVSTDPPNGGESERTTAITLVFSEVVASLSTTLTGSVILTDAGLSSSTVVLSGIKLYGTNRLTITAAPDSAGNAFARFITTGNTITTFVVVANATASTATTTSAATYTVAISAPAVGAAHRVGDDIRILWTTEGSTGAVGAANIAYSTDDGVTYTDIVVGTANDWSYEWVAPDIDSAVILRVQASDLVNVLATATSGSFTIGDVVVESDDATAEETAADATPVVADPADSLIKGTSWSTIYSVDENGNRRPFLDEQTFFTYADSFDGVVTVADADLANYPIGEPMLPKAGVVLVKVVSLNNVYALAEDNTLRWITSESLAINLYGGGWADYVIDVPATAWPHFTIGDDIATSADIAVNDSLLQTRTELNSR